VLQFFRIKQSYLSLAIIFAYSACNADSPAPRLERIEESASFPQKLAYCTIPQGEARSQLVHDYFWLVQTDIHEASLVAVERGGDEGSSSDRFVVFGLKLAALESGFSTEIISESYGIESGRGAIELNPGTIPIAINFDSNSGLLGEISGYQYSGDLNCWRYQGRMPY